MNPELNILNHILKTKDMITPLNGDCEKSFLLYGDEFQWLREYFLKYREVPPVEVFQDKFPNCNMYNTDASMEFYIDELHKWKARHELQEIIHDAASSLNDYGPYSTINKLHTRISKLGRDTRLVRDLDLVANSEERLENLRERIALRASGRQLIGIPSGFKAIDKHFGGWQRGDFIVVSGWTGSLKSWLCLYFGMHAWSQGYRVLYISLEMSGLQIGYRFDTLVSGGEFSNTDLTHAENILFDRYKTWLGDNLKDKPPFIVVTNEDLEDVNQSTVLSKIEQWKPDLCHVKGTDIFVDDKWMKVEEYPNARFKESPVLELKLKALPISEKITPEHMYWTRRIESSATKQERIREKGVPYYNIPRHLEEGWTEAKDLTNKHYIGMPVNERLIEVPNDLDEFKSADWWWAFGYWWGDGNINQNYVEFSVADDHVKILDRLINLGRSIGHRPSVVQLQGCKKVKLSHSAMARWLSTWRTGNSIKKPPVWVESIDPIFQEELIAGYIAADGHRTESGYTLTSINLDGLLCVRRILARLNRSCQIYKGNPPGTREFPNGITSETKQSYVLHLNDRAYELTVKYMRNSFVDGSYLWTRVDSIESCGLETVVPINTTFETYQTHFGKSHNCILDYHHLFDDSSGATGEVEKTKNLSKAFKRIALRTGVPIIDITSVTQDKKDMGIKPPELFDLAWSKQLAYDSDLTLALCREGNYLEVISRKSRRSKEIHFHIEWDVDKGHVKELSKEVSESGGD